MKERAIYAVAGLLIGSVLAGWVALEWSDRRVNKLQTDTLITAGWIRAKIAKHPEKAAPDIDTGPLDSAGIDPAVAGTINTRYVPVPAPFNNSRCPDAVPPSDSGPGGMLPTIAASPPLLVSVEAQFVAGLTKRADLFFDGKITAHFRRGLDESSVDLPAEDVDVRMSSDLRGVLRRGTRPRFNLVPSLRDIETGWVVGAGMCYGTRGPDACGFVGYAVQF